MNNCIQNYFKTPDIKYGIDFISGVFAYIDFGKRVLGGIYGQDSL